MRKCHVHKDVKLVAVPIPNTKDGYRRECPSCEAEKVQTTYTRNVLVFAGTVEQAIEYIRTQSNSPDRFHIITRAVQVAGHTDYDIETVGTYYNNERVREAYEYAWQRKKSLQ